MLRRTLELLVIASFVPVPALAADLTFSLQGDTQYDSNVFRRENNIEDDWLFHIVPGVRLHEDRGQDANYSLSYRMPVRFAVDHYDRLQDIDHLANGTVRYHVNDRMDLFASDDFRYLRTTIQQGGGDLGSAGVPSLSTRNERVTINIAELGTSYRFSPRLTGQLIGHHNYFDTDLRNRQENWSAGAFGDLQYTLNAQHVVGFGARYIHAKFEDSDNFLGSKSNTYNAFASWRYQITETTAFSMSAGPSYIDVDQDDAPATIQVPQGVPVGDPGPIAPDGVVYAYNSCPETVPGSGQRYIPAGGCGLVALADAAQRTAVDNWNTALGTPFTLTNTDPAGGSSDDLTVFGDVVLSQRWTPNLASALRYERSQGSASGLGGTVTRDAVSFSTTWDFRERWQFAFRGDWTQRKSVADVAQVFNLAQGFDVGGGYLAAEYTGASGSGAPASNRIDTNRWGVAGRLTHRMWRNTNLFVELAYHEQVSRASSLGNFSDFEDFLATFGVRHVFEPIKLW